MDVKPALESFSVRPLNSAVRRQFEQMRKQDVRPDLTAIAFDFFYWFSRFEFALKENAYLKKQEVGERAEPGWGAFVREWEGEYQPSPEAMVLLTERPERQIVGPGNTLDWKPVDLKSLKSDLDRVVSLLKTVRNNLFHGGKHGGAGWDNPEKTKVLLESGKAVLDQLADMADLEADYTQYY